MAADLVGFKGEQFVARGWEVRATRGAFVEVDVQLIALTFGNNNVDTEKLAAALTKSLGSPEVQKVINKQLEIELEKERIITL